MKMKTASANRLLAVVIVLVVAADWLSKLWVTNRLLFGETLEIIDGWFYIIHRQNSGIAFSLFADASTAAAVPLLSALAAVGIAVFIGIFRSAADRWTRFAAAAVIAGAIANLGDRLHNGEVTDFLHLTFFPFVFNLADAAITVGAALLAFRLASDRGHAPPPAATG